MQAKYILEAIEAMERVENLPANASAEVTGKAMAQLTCARIRLRIYSHIDDAEIAIEPEDQFTEIPRDVAYVDSNGQPVPF